MSAISTSTSARGSVWGNTSKAFYSGRLHEVPPPFSMSPHWKTKQAKRGSLYIPRVFLVSWCFDYTMRVLFSQALCTVGKCFHLGAEFCSGAALSDTQWRQGSAPDTSHTQSGLRESSGGCRRSAGASSVPALPKLSVHLFYVSPSCFIPRSHRAPGWPRG